MRNLRLLFIIIILALQCYSLLADITDFPTDYQAAVNDNVSFVPIIPAITKNCGSFVVSVENSGRVGISYLNDSYNLESCYSYPGPDRKIGWNGLNMKFSQDSYPDVLTQLSNDPEWHPVVSVSGDDILVSAVCESYIFERRIKVLNNKIQIIEKFTNRLGVPVGIVPRYRLVSNSNFEYAYAVNIETACNPILFAQYTSSSVGLLMEDNISRRRMRPWRPASGNRIGFQILRLALDAGKTLTLEYSIYPQTQNKGYLSFINQVRKDWKSNFTINGPFAYAYIVNSNADFSVETSSYTWNTNDLLENPTAFRNYLKYKNIKIMAVAPWLDYDPGAFDHVVSRDEYRQYVSRFVSVMHKAAPEVKVIGCIETDWVTIPADTMPDGYKLPRQADGLLNETLTSEQIQIIENAFPGWNDSFVRSADGKLFVECYRRAGVWVEPAVRVFPAIGNKRYDNINEQVRFLIEEIGLDGVYLDEFSLGVIGSQRAYNGSWDGLSADVDFNTGEIYGKYIDCSLAGIDAREELIKYLVNRKKIIVANFYSTSKQEQSLPVMRFAEQGWGLKDMNWEDGTKPPSNNYMFFGHLNSPIGLGINNSAIGWNTSRQLMKGLITYLRHGLLMYYNMLAEQAVSYDVVNKMFPITPVELGEGFIIGKEKIISAISSTFKLKSALKPIIHIYGLDTQEVTPGPQCSITKVNNEWQINLNIIDWSQIAIIETVEVGPVAWYHFDEEAGNVAIDSSGNGNNGTIQGAAYVSNGSGGYALRFDGVDDCVNVAESSSLASISAGSVEMWYKIPATPTEMSLFTMQYPNTSWTDMRLIGYIRNDEPTFTYISDGSNYGAVNCGNAIRDQWVHYAATWDGTRMKGYQNGVLKYDWLVTTLPALNGIPLGIGKVAVGVTSQNFKGDMDEFILWNQVLSAETILQHYQAGVPAAAPVASYNFDEGTGNVAFDSSGHGNDGTINGASYVDNGAGGYALHFDGINDWIKVLASNSLASISTGSVEMWYKVPASPVQMAFFTMKNPGTNWTDMMLTGFIRDDGLTFTYVSDGTNYSSIHSGTAIRNGWAHYAATWNGTIMKGYKNGVLQIEWPVSTLPTLTNIPLWIGRADYVVSEWFIGDMDEFRLWSVPLTAETILQHYQAGFQVPLKYTLSGNVNLSNYSGDITNVPVTVELNGTSITLNLDEYGNFSILDVANGTYDIRIKASHWLAKLTSGIIVAGNTVMDSVTLINGDVVNNNGVDFSDINAVRTAYGSFPGNETWNEQADVNGSDSVDFADINIVRSNYGKIGD